MQSELLGISRGCLSYEPRPVSDDDLKLMRHTDKWHVGYLLGWNRMMEDNLCQEGFTAGQLQVTILMRTMGTET
ncbi:MAG: hypothetical protein AAGE03_04990 [Pseudomonadota bacterium]